MTATACMPAAWPLAAGPCEPPLSAPPAARALVGSVVGQRGGVVCAAGATLADAADLLVLHDRTAAGVVDAEGHVLGALTENDILQAYAAGASPLLPLSSWLQSGLARLPAPLLEALTVRPDTPLLEAAARMRAQATSGEGAFRHLVVREADGTLVGMLSSLDLARALCCTAAHQEIMQGLGHDAVAQVMKHRAALASCSTSASVGQVLEKMICSRQNCVLVADGEEAHHPVTGVFTTRDVLRAFSEHIPLDTPVGHWQRGLQSSWMPRLVRADVPLLGAAATMAAHSLHHLVVVSLDNREIVGVVSSADLAQSVGAAERFVDGFSPREDDAVMA